jgi:uncharacterized protein
MAERTQYDPGTFCWIDLATTDTEGAKAFYSGLFGWEAEDRPVGQGIVYSTMRLQGHDVAGVGPLMPMQVEQGVPPHWNNYVAVQSADETAQRAGELGANVVAPPFDVLDAGRMASLQDPQGAFLNIWEARTQAGARLVNVPGALSWNDLATPDVDAATRFYGDLFGWTFESFDIGGGDYRMVRNRERGNGGIRQLGPAEEQAGIPPHWMPYIAHADLDRGVAEAERLGGRKLADPVDIGVGRVAVVADPQGGAFLLYAGQLQD